MGGGVLFTLIPLALQVTSPLRMFVREYWMDAPAYVPVAHAVAVSPPMALTISVKFEDVHPARSSDAASHATCRMGAP